MDNNTILEKMISSNKFGTFFGVSQEVIDRVWASLTDPGGNSVTYVSMEIGADNDALNPVQDAVRALPFTSKDPRLKYFTNKFLHDSGKIPNYSGGVGVLAGDTLKSYADCAIPAIGISLLYRKGYFSQLIDSRAGQIAYSTQWRPEETANLYLLKDPQSPDIPLQIEIPFYERGDKRVSAYANLWMKMEINSTLDHFVPEILLDYSIPTSPAWVGKAAEHLYDSRSERTKIIQRRLLGAGVIPVMQALGITSKTIHLNEQHGVVVVLHLIAAFLKEKFGPDYPMLAEDSDILLAAEEAAKRMVYTIHTPVKAGHDRFSKDLYAEIGHTFCQRVLGLLADDEDNADLFNFTNLAMKVNRASNSVSRIHQQVTKKQFPKYAKKIRAVTNGIHHLTWISKAKAELYDGFKELNHWRQDPGIFVRAAELQGNNRFRTYLEQAWLTDTTRLTNYIDQMIIQHRNQMQETWIDPPNFISHLEEKERRLNPHTFTIGFARRFSTYKRADLIFDNIPTLAEIVVKNNWPVNFIFAGKAHPSDEPGKSIIKLLLDRQQELYEASNGLAKLIFIPNYDMSVAKLMVAGVHSWLNTPKRPLEASGTSGMKAALNGIPNISTMDGWWVEGYHEGKTGWKFGIETTVTESCLSEDAACLLYEEDSVSFYKLFPKILKTFYDQGLRSQLIDKCVNNLILNAPIFNTHRVTAEYMKLYDLPLAEPIDKRMVKLAALYDSNR